MDQPQQPNNHGISWEWIAASLFGVLATLASIWGKNKASISRMNAKIKAETEPAIETGYLEANKEITRFWQGETDKLRLEIDNIRKQAREDIDSARSEAAEWMERAIVCESRVPFVEKEFEALKVSLADRDNHIAALTRRVAELERQVNGKGREA